MCTYVLVFITHLIATLRKQVHIDNLMADKPSQLNMALQCLSLTPCRPEIFKPIVLQTVVLK